MTRKCEVTGKGTRSGKSIARRGLPKKKGGIGLKTTGHTKRKFKANIQKVRVLLPNGTVRRMRLATSVIKSGKITLVLEVKKVRAWRKPMENSKGPCSMQFTHPSTLALWRRQQ